MTRKRNLTNRLLFSSSNTTNMYMEKSPQIRSNITSYKMAIFARATTPSNAHRNQSGLLHLYAAAQRNPAQARPSLPYR